MMMMLGVTTHVGAATPFAMTTPSNKTYFDDIVKHIKDGHEKFALTIARLDSQNIEKEECDKYKNNEHNNFVLIQKNII